MILYDYMEGRPVEAEGRAADDQRRVACAGDSIYIDNIGTPGAGVGLPIVEQNGELRVGDAGGITENVVERFR